MPRCCSIRGCITGTMYDRKWRRKTGLKPLTLFGAPKFVRNPVLFEKWNQVISVTGRHLSESDYVCLLHFKEEDVYSHYETKLPDGTLWKLEKGSVTLKKGAIPSIFPDLANHQPLETTIKLPFAVNGRKKKWDSNSLKNKLTSIIAI